MTEIKELRTKAGFTQAQLAERMDVTEQTIQNWESGKTTPKKDTMTLLLKELGITRQSDQARIIGELAVANTKESDEFVQLEKLPTFLFSESSGELEMIKACMATAEELDMLAYADYMSRRGRYARREWRTESSFPMEFAFFERYGGFNKTMKRISDTRSRLGGLYSEALVYAAENPGYDYRLASFDKTQIINKIGIFLGKNTSGGSKDYSEKIEELYRDLAGIGETEFIYSIDGKLQNKDIVRKVSKSVHYNTEYEPPKQSLGRYEGYIEIESREKYTKESVEILKLTERGKQLIRWFEES